MSEVPRKDLVVLAADKDAEHAIKGLLQRPEALGIRPVTADFRVHPEHDPACRLRAHELLRDANRYEHALVVFDHEGSGGENKTPEALQQAVEDQLAQHGWDERAAAVVIQPELEIWVWSDSPKVDETLGWAGRQPDLRTWLRSRGLLGASEIKPVRPKKAMRAALAGVRKPVSAALFLQLAQSVSFTRCTDSGFRRLADLLRNWFPRQAG